MKNADLANENEVLKNRIIELEALVKYYEGQFRLNKHQRFGSKSEKSEYDFSQLSVFNEAELSADDNVTEPALVMVAKHYRKRKRLVNDELPDNLPVEVIWHKLPAKEQFCPLCEGPLHVIGKEKRRELVIIPAQVKIREHIREIYGCRECEEDEFGEPVFKTPVDNPVIKGSFASPEAIAHTMVQKFVMGVPLYRQEQEWVRRGINLSRQTMSNWVLKAAEDWLEPIYDVLHEIIIASDVIHADETTLQVLHEPGKSAQSKSYMWLYRTSGYNSHGVKLKYPAILYEYQPGRNAKYPKEFLKGFEGYCHADGYDGYHSLPENIKVVGCLSHARRKWDEALKTLPEKDREGSSVLRGKRYCDKLFELERQFADLTPDERLSERQEISKPLLNEFFEWCSNLKATPKSAIGIAANYMLKQRKYLKCYLEDGRLEISNNRAERSIKPFVISRKNFLFANTPRGAKASAIVFSIIETAKETGLDPYKYLVHVFKNAPNWDIRCNRNYLDLLMPYAFNVHDTCGVPAKDYSENRI
jgi:transposase